MGPLSILEAVKNSDKDIKFYQASSSEMFGGIDSQKLDENSKFIPKSPMPLLKFLHIKLIRSTESRMIYLESTEFYLIMNLLIGEKRL